MVAFAFPPPQPESGLTNADKENFSTLLAAALNGDLAIVSAIRKSDHKPIALLCAMQRNNDGTTNLVPLAVLVEGNPFEDFI